MLISLDSWLTPDMRRLLLVLAEYRSFVDVHDVVAAVVALLGQFWNCQFPDPSAASQELPAESRRGKPVEPGVYHISGPATLSRIELANRFLEATTVAPFFFAPASEGADTAGDGVADAGAEHAENVGPHWRVLAKVEPHHRSDANLGYDAPSRVSFSPDTTRSLLGRDPTSVEDTVRRVFPSLVASDDPFGSAMDDV